MSQKRYNCRVFGGDTGGIDGFQAWKLQEVRIKKQSNFIVRGECRESCR